MEEAEIAAATVLSSLKRSRPSPVVLSNAGGSEPTPTLLQDAEAELDALLSELSENEARRSSSSRPKRARVRYPPEPRAQDVEEGSSSTTLTTVCSSPYAGVSTTSSPLTSLSPSPAPAPATSTPPTTQPTTSSSPPTGKGRRHPCPHPSCPTSTSRASDLRRHLLTHSQQTYTCDACGAAFGRRDGVGWHLRMGRCPGADVGSIRGKGRGGKGGKRGRKGGRRK